MITDAFLKWVCKEERPGCFRLFLGFFFIVGLGPLLPVFLWSPVSLNGKAEPGAFYFTVMWAVPFVVNLVLSDSKKHKASFSRAYLCGFVVMSILSVIYIAYILYSDNYRYEYIGDELIRILVIIPLYYAGLSLLFFVIEIIANAITKRRERNLGCDEEIEPELRRWYGEGD